MTFESIRKGQSQIRTDKNIYDELRCMVVLSEVNEMELFNAGWALRPARGKAIRKNTYKLYMTDTNGWILTGMEEKRKK